MKHSIHKKSVILFVVIWLHMSLLNLFFVNHSGVVFLWTENSQPTTFAVHILIALITTCVFLLGQKVHQHYVAGVYKIREPILVLASCCMVISIIFVLMS